MKPKNPNIRNVAFGLVSSPSPNYVPHAALMIISHQDTTNPSPRRGPCRRHSAPRLFLLRLRARVEALAVETTQSVISSVSLPSRPRQFPADVGRSQPARRRPGFMAQPSSGPLGHQNKHHPLSPKRPSNHSARLKYQNGYYCLALRKDTRCPNQAEMHNATPTPLTPCGLNQAVASRGRHVPVDNIELRVEKIPRSLT